MAAVRALAVVRLMKVRRRGARRKRLGILHTASEPHAPSCSGSIRAFMRAAAGQGLDAVILGKDAIQRVEELDGLLIRDLTSPRNHTYDFARAAEARGIPVLDDARSIVRCSDKVFLHHELTKAGVPTPRGVILTAADAVAAAIDALGLPLVLKLPEGAFSKGVYRVISRPEAETKLFKLMSRAPAVVAQEYLPTAFDWRIGVLAGGPLFACRYHMAPGHWQIVDHRHEQPCEGAVEPLALADAPAEAVALALKASARMGEGLYGVDIKERGGRFYVIEVNDNPDIHDAFEASRPSDRVWSRIAGWFAERAIDRAVPAAA